MRTSLKMLVVGVALLGSLTACSKPAPEVSVFSGANSVHSAALCWSSDAATACNTQTVGTAHDGLTIQQGGPLGISVDSDIADAGWVPQLIINGQPQSLTTAPLHRRYWKMQFPETAGSSLMGHSVTLEVIALTDNQQSPRGVWSIALTPSENPNNA